MTQPVAVLFLTHLWSHAIRHRFARLVAEVGDKGDVVLLIRDTEESARLLAEMPPEAGEVAPFNQEQLPEILGYPTYSKDALVPGSTHFPLLEFHRRRPTYEHYFVIEFDVEFTGNWGDLISDLLQQNPDFVSTHYYSFHDRSGWTWWSNYRPSPRDSIWAVEQKHLWRTFNPIFCLSRTAIQLIDSAHRDGWIAHYEMLLATLMTNRGCRIVDLRELGYCVGRTQDMLEFLIRGDISTIRWRPAITREEFVARADFPTLFHPVKEDWFFDGEQIVSLSSDATVE